ncbi:hypothetical protein [Patiriisocius marinus]|uniref:Lipoprotein n=1 Tax=Patiriisocius marinus TaxID=1397112 RepID=A0A5J4IYF1_9FLAO|nr:hypothetical protein [Patiriisocius marinus]GER59472.1 hypothetical protein ULMA_15800 [Patiriisocius marinus]
MKTTSFKNSYDRLLKFLVIVFIATSFVACKQNTSATSNATGEDYTSEMTKSDKKKYKDTSGNVVYEVKYKSDGFKLRTANSDLLWKVKLYPEKIKISDNEENEHPYEIKLIGILASKLVKDDKELARLKMESGNAIITYKNGDEETSFKAYYSSTLLINEIDEIAADQKDIIIRELKAKGY